MMTRRLALIATVAASSLIAAEARRQPAFNEASISLPALTLSRGPATTPQTLSSSATGTARSQPAPFPMGRTDLLAPAHTRDKIIQDFRALANPPMPDRFNPDRERQEPSYIPVGPLDLIGRKADRDKVIREVRSRLDAEETRTRR